MSMFQEMNIPPLISRTPPPIDDDEDDDYDDFGSFVHDTIEEDVIESERAETPTLNNILHSKNSEIEDRISAKLGQINSVPVENSFGGIKEPEISINPSDFNVPIHLEKITEKLEFVSYNNIQPEFKCDFNGDSSRDLDQVISDSDSIFRLNGEESTTLNIEDPLKSHDVESLNDSLFNANGSSPVFIGYEENSECDNISEDEKINFSPHTILENDVSKSIKESVNDSERTSEESILSEKEVTIKVFNEPTQAVEDTEDLNDFGDDEFDDFADFQSSFVPEPPPEPLASTSTCTFEEPNEEPKINFFEDTWSQDFSLDSSQLSEHFDTNIVTNSMVWQKLQYLEDTPALKYTWSTSTSNHKMLRALKIDSRNILCGPWSKSYRSLASEGKHFEGLIPCDYGKPTCSTDAVPKASVPEAHFDWEGSGLTNPLFMVAKDENFLEYDLNNIVTKKLNPISEDILQGLPSLSYIKKPYIVFNRSAS